MITVKKAGDQGAEGNSAGERYRFSDSEKKSGVPYVLAASLALIALFIRSATSFMGKPAVAEEAMPNTSELAPPREDAVVAVAAIEALPPTTIDIPALPSRVDESTLEPNGTNVLPFPSRAFRFADPASFSFTETPSAGPLAVAPPIATPTVATDGSAKQPSLTQEDATPDPDAPVAPPDKPSPTERNRAPTHNGAVRLNDAVTGAVVMIAFSQLLDGVIDSDGDSLAIQNVKVSSGAFGLTDEGLVFSSNLLTTDAAIAIEYEISDGIESIARTATFKLAAGPILGTPAADVLSATERADHIDAGEGDDLITALGGADVIHGGGGNDIISAGTGNDVVFAGAGDDVVFAGSGADVVWAGHGDDRVSGGDGDDHLLGEGGADALLGEEGADLLNGGEGNDWLDGGNGDDVLLGGDGDDRLTDGAGTDQVLGDAGNDTVIVALDAVGDIFIGGEGADTLDLSEAAKPVSFDFAAGRALSEEIGVDQFDSFETVVGGSGNDVFTVAGQPMRLVGGDGDDEFIFATPAPLSSAILIHQIVDFVLGDRVRVAEFELTLAEDDREDHFSRYRDRNDERDDEGLRLRIHSHSSDGQEFTEFEFDFNGDEDFEMRILLQGQDHPFVYETSVA